MKALSVAVSCCAAIVIGAAAIFVQADVSHLVRISPILAAVYIGIPVGLSLRQLGALESQAAASGRDPDTGAKRRANGDVLLKALTGLLVVGPLLWVLAPSFDSRPLCALVVSSFVFIVVSGALAHFFDRFAEWLAPPALKDDNPPEPE